MGQFSRFYSDEMKITNGKKIVFGVAGFVLVTVLAIYEFDMRHVHNNMLIAYLAFVMMYIRVLREVKVDSITTSEGESRAEKIFLMLDVTLMVLDLLVMVAYLFI